MNIPCQLEVSLDAQTLTVRRGELQVNSYSISSGVKGMGFQSGSNRTPWGNFRIVEKIGEDQPSGTIFKSRVPVGKWNEGERPHEDLILTRILWLEGLDTANGNTQERYIYIHGTNQENLLGQPASQGCIRLANNDMIELFNTVKVGDAVVIYPQTHKRGKILFLDCDSTLSTIEGIDELARVRGPQVYDDVVALTHAAMNGELPISEVFSRRMEIIRPDRSVAEAVAQRYLETIVPGAREFVDNMKKDGWLPVILSGGFAPLIEPLAKELGIAHVEAVPLYFNPDGSYAGYGDDYPTTRNLGKNVIIREWKEALLPEKIVMVGDGVSDLETRPDVDVFIAFTGVIDRPLVSGGAEYQCVALGDIRGIV